MAAARDQAARAIRTGPEMAEGEAPRDPAQLAEQLRHVAEDAKRPPDTTPATPATDKPAAPPASATQPAAPKSGKRKFVMMGVLALLAIAAAGYGIYYTLIGRFYVSTDDA